MTVELRNASPTLLAGGEGTNGTFKLPEGSTVGDIAVFALQITPYGAAQIAESMAITGWTGDTAVTNAGNLCSRVFWKRIETADLTATFTVTWTGTSEGRYRRGACWVFKGNSSSLLVDGTPTGHENGFTTEGKAESVTTAKANSELIHLMISDGSGEGKTPPSGFTGRSAGANYPYLSEGLQSTAGASGAKTGAWSTARWLHAHMLAIPVAEEAAPEEHTSWFAAKSWFNKALPTSPPLLSNSAGIVATLAAKVAAGSPHVWLSTTNGGVWFYEVPEGQATQKVTISETSGQQEKFEAVPIPTGGATAAIGTDHHMVIWQPSTGKMWEFWNWGGSSGSYTAGAGGFAENVATNFGTMGGSYGPPTNIGGAFSGAASFWGATATALPLVGGLITFNDLRAGSINHALALAGPGLKKGHVFPAQRHDPGLTAEGESDIPEGACFKLKASYNVAGSSLKPLAKKMATAAQTYGIYVRDSAPEVTFYGQEPRTEAQKTLWKEALGGLEPSEALEGFPFSELEVVDLASVYVTEEAKPVRELAVLGVGA